MSLGCPKNLVDSEVMLGLLEKAGYKIVQNPAEAEILIVNTCGFIEDAKKESVDTILEMSGYKATPTPRGEAKGKCKKLIVTGCLPQRYKSELAKLLPEVDLFIGTGEYHKIVELLCHPEQPKEAKDPVNAIKRMGSFGRRPQDDRELAMQTINTPQYIHNATTPRKIATAKHAVYLKIAEGCFHGCSFCIIPKLRGKFRSRSMDDIAVEAKMLIDNGAKELNLIAQDTTSYGVDLKDGSNLAKLIERINNLKSDFWIRIMYAYPTSITDEFISAVQKLPKVCRYLDIPIQHVSDKILSAMRRKENGNDVRKIVAKLRTKMPDITLRTSLIVGFPGETKKEFMELLSFVREGHFNHLGAFTYSQEEGTYAAKLSGQVPKKVKEERRNAIMEAQAKVARRRNKGLVGKKLKILIEGENAGRITGQAPEIDGITFIEQSKSEAQKIKVGEFSSCVITGIKGYDLKGKLC
ncbi:MAG: 30S ribosomal protein S12 methylthiotransferase RimO [Deltaproteobacteria bacterium]|nr:30S ribosomal protein S12 methylthiotransferase RimO [Deltaproteobacteria bacterium]